MCSLHSQELIITNYTNILPWFVSEESRKLRRLHKSKNELDSMNKQRLTYLSFYPHVCLPSWFFHFPVANVSTFKKQNFLHNLFHEFIKNFLYKRSFMHDATLSKCFKLYFKSKFPLFWIMQYCSKRYLKYGYYKQDDGTSTA